MSKQLNTIKVLPLSPGTIRPVWSVMIPAYNCSKYLRKTIESVLLQDRGINIMEIWVVDDCSRENPERLVEELGKGRINFYRQEHNVGQLNNFSTCLNLAKGKIIHLLHGDDFVHDGFYKKLEGPLLADDSIGAAFTGNDIVDQDNEVVLVSDLLAPGAGILDNFLTVIGSKQVIQTPSIVVKREVYEKLGAFNKDLTWLEDWEMWIRIACNYRFYYDPAMLASYRIHDTSNTTESLKTGRFVKDVRECIGVYSGYLKLPEKEKKVMINSARQHFLLYARNQSRQRLSVLILIRGFPLVYDFASFFFVTKEILKISVKAIIAKTNLFRKEKSR
ncbi:MAG: glycosyltransferase [Ferruginibacter sp.]